MNRIAAILGSAALAAALVAGGFAFAQGAFAVTPLWASLALQQDGTCRGHVGYAIGLTDTDVATEMGVEQASVEVKAPCARLTALGAGETFDTKQGKLTVAVRSATAFVHVVDPDGTDNPATPEVEGPRQAGECDVVVTALATLADANSDAAKVFRRPRTIERTRANATCSALTNVISNSCWVARGSWPADAPFPSIPQCP